MILAGTQRMRHVDALVARFGERPVLGGWPRVAATIDRERGQSPGSPTWEA